MRYKRSANYLQRNISNTNDTVKEDGAVYITKDITKTFDIEKCAKSIECIRLDRLIKEKFGNVNEKIIVKEMFKEINSPDTEYLDGKEVFKKIRRAADEW